MLWWMVAGVNWLTLCQECRKAVFWASYCSSCTLWRFLRSENKLMGYVDDSNLMAVLSSPADVRVTVAESLIRDLGRVSEWFYLWGMKLYASKTKTMIISRSHTMHPQLPPLTIGGTVLRESDDLVIYRE